MNLDSVNKNYINFKEVKMQNWPQKLKCWRAGAKNGAYLGLVIVFVSFGSGCATTRKTTTTETTVTSNEPAEVSSDQQSETTTTTTTETETETKAKRPGIISSTFHAIGYVIALPFIVIGGLFRIIFGG